MRAEPARLKHRHCRSHAVGARDIAGGQHDTASAPADDYRLVGEGRVVALFDRGIERVAIDMRNRERFDLRMPQQPRRAACRATAASIRYITSTVTAEARHCPPRW